jgi:hypothetical protein
MHLCVSEMNLFTHIKLRYSFYYDREKIECMTWNHLLTLVVMHQPSQEYDCALHRILNCV